MTAIEATTTVISLADAEVPKCPRCGKGHPVRRALNEPTKYSCGHLDLLAAESREHLGAVCRRCGHGRIKTADGVVDVEQVEIRSGE